MSDYRYDAGLLAVGWLSVALAAGKDPELPILNRTMLIEEYDKGLRFVATDRYVLLRAFVPNLAHEIADEPGIDEAPEDSAIAMDLDGRARGLLGYLHGLAKQAAKDGNGQIEVSVSLNVVDDTDAPTFEGLERRYVRFDYASQERLQLDTFGDRYPEWRALVTKVPHATTDAIALNPEIVGRLAKLGKLHYNMPIVWKFGGEDKPAEIEVLHSEPRLTGIVMPIRLNGPES